MEGLLLLLIAIGFLNESETPVWTEEPIECKQITFEPSDFEKGESDVDAIFHSSSVHNAKARIEKTVRNSYICVEEPEVVRLPAYKELLNLPPAEQMPIVAVYQFLDKTGQRKDVGQGQSFSTATTQGGL